MQLHASLMLQFDAKKLKTFQFGTKLQKPCIGLIFRVFLAYKTPKD